MTTSKTLIFLAIAVASCVESKQFGSLASIPTHHGIDAAVHLSGGGGGAVATRTKKKALTVNKAEPIVSTYYQKNEVESTSNAVASAPAVPAVTNKDALSPIAIVCMSLLAVQFGIQPILVRRYTPQTIVRSSVILVQEVVKFVIAGGIYLSGTSKEKRVKDFEGWTLHTWIALAGLPALLYTIQNISSLMAYQNLEALTFNVLNQTKILSAALFCFLVMGKRQSRMQVASLVLLTLSTLIIEKIVHPTAFMTLIKGSGPTFGLGKFMERMLGGDNFGRRFTHGIIPIIVASGISGLAGALTQLNLQGGGSKLSIWGKKDKPNVPRPPRNAYLFSMEMNVASVILLLVSLVMSSGGRSILRTPSTFFSNWTPQTFIPVITNAIGGILVGLVTKHAGSVRKGFALIFGLLLSGLFQANGSGIRCEQVVGGLMAAASLWLHTVHPYKAPHSNKKA